ncbi:hypothetical protein ACH5RR_016465 [Cinchona calisaya]|uniref:Retrotransposon gag domain-containing protein n=1 Tax=Cinchona calisaya TaxID=153742 RepID=A0ABD2ZY37_9GENT
MSMTPEIMKQYLCLLTVHKIWSALSKAFYDGSDELQIFALNQKTFISKQSGKSLSKYYGKLVEIFRELDHQDEVVMKDPDDVITYQKFIERLRVYIFLVRLDGDFEQVCGEILRKEPIPGLEECYALIRREAICRATLKDNTRNSEATAMSGHTKDCCYELVGYPEWWDHSRAYRKKNSKKTPTAAIAETNIGDDAVEKGSALVATTNICDTEKGNVNGMTLDLDNHLEVEEMPESQDASSSLEEFESLTNIPHQSSTENVPILQPELPRKQLPKRLSRGIPKPTYESELSSKVK